MTLHEAMVRVLQERGAWMNRDELAREIASRDLYRQKTGGAAPADQLRLRARKYGHLFEGSDNAFTRIRLRADAPRTYRSPASRSSSSSTAHPSRGVGPTRSARAAAPRAAGGAEATARRRRARASAKYKPDRVELLLIAEAPPAALDRYFYFEDVAQQDSLFRYVARSLLGVEPTREGKPEMLSALRDRGVFLIDVSNEPLGTTPLARSVPDLVKRATAVAPAKVILIKATVYDHTFAALRDVGLPVVDERVPFPGSGQQKRFEAAFARALEQ
jgi:hypothetical protein